jgi:flagellar hook protein FlgE
MAFDSLYVGVTGLEAYQNQMDVISNNIANVSTTGYKGQDVNFQDVLYQAQSFSTAPTQNSGGVNGQDVGLGVKIGSIDTNFSQGGLQTTGVNTNLAMNGDGFFVLRKPNAGGAPTYTRNGDFSLNANGLLYDPSSGLAVQGYLPGANGQITQTGTPSDITIPLGLKSQAVGTGLNANQKYGPTGDQNFDLAVGGDLDQSQWIKEAQGVQAGTAGTGGAFTTSTTVYDSLGNPHAVTLTYTPDATGATAAAAGPPPVAASSGLPASVSDASGTAQTPAARWKVTATFQDGTTFDTISNPGAIAAGNVAAPTYAAASSGVIGYAYFDQSGQYINTAATIGAQGAAPGGALTGAAVHATGQQSSSAVGNQLNIRTWGTSATNQSIGPTAPGAAPSTGPIGLDLHAITSLTSGQAGLNVIGQNGYAFGTLSNITIGADGSIEGAFSNGQQQVLGRVAVATFQNEGGLQRVGSSDFTTTANSGTAQYGTAGSGRFGSMVSGSLEQSNVSIADQFTKMIAAQNAYQANSKSITTASEDMQTVIGLIR